MNNYIIEESNENEAELVVENLVNYNLSKVPKTQQQAFVWINRIIKNNDGEIIAGINSKMYCWNCIYIDSLWVDRAFRKEGIGTKLLNEVERIAIEQGCKLIHLDTFDFQAKDFYIKQGYEVFGVLNECPYNHKRYYMKKNIKK
ncbi:GNAT family N-acetyltransferase [Clostridium saccharoperbutylacetonicum]|uniref:GNAT family N-acetyltransferase n=1 Tax=Clostridium saccharoperbutylacetonicum TaxID=36745 RepID=UPI0009839D0F|nr:GNAT family N-acetyltransferase [Clostridium saccharoperbutylacetonicum]AQR96249.1 acetyltransferase (GNAT) family protein [Clostridium saccharoperbutylacetonicum]NSB32122.1 ribosomal protein S18 acetylase RimI-like enzyme [Clostridium saccharoperbutylacetonicum]